MNIDEQIQALKREVPADNTHDEAYRRLLKPTQSKRVGSWRWVAVGATCALLAIPVLLRRPGNAAYANPFLQVIKASDAAPIVHEVMTYSPRTGPEPKLKIAERWTSGGLFRCILRFEEWQDEYRAGQTYTYTSVGQPPYEYFSKRLLGKDPDLSTRGYWLKDILAAAVERGANPDQYEKKKGVFMNRSVDVYDIQNFVWDTNTKKYEPHGVRRVYTDPTTSRALGIQIFSDAEGKNKLSESVIDYPTEIDRSIFEIPAKTSIPRYNPDEEATKIVDQGALVHVKSVKGEMVHLLSATRNPGDQLTVIWRGTPSGSDASHPPILVGSTVKPKIYKIGGPTSNVIAAAFNKANVGNPITVKIPVYRSAGSKSVFLGYASYPDVAAFQTMPISIFQGLMMRK